jgi:hypothetical protein
MSNRQFSFLRYLSGARGTKIDLEELSNLNQGTIGSAKRRNWLVETPGRDGVQLTYDGKQALKQFEHGDFMRSVARMKFSSYLSLESYDEPATKPGNGRKTRKGAPKRKAAGSGMTVLESRGQRRVA